jgi:hypothetical protein
MQLTLAQDNDYEKVKQSHCPPMIAMLMEQLTKYGPNLKVESRCQGKNHEKVKSVHWPVAVG